jgi:hypothetical protein
MNKSAPIFIGAHMFDSDDRRGRRRLRHFLDDNAMRYWAEVFRQSALQIPRFRAPVLQEMGPTAGAAYELADRRLKLGVPTPAAAPMPTAPDSSSREVSTSPYGTAADLAKYAIKPREHEIDQVPPLPTSTASEVSSPATSASPAEPGPSAETAVAQPGGRLIVLRAPNFGWNMALSLKIDGRTTANIVQGRRYDGFVPEGRHTLTVAAVPNYQPTSTVLDVQSGQTYVFTATRQNTDSVVLVPSALPPGQN